MSKKVHFNEPQVPSRKEKQHSFIIRWTLKLPFIRTNREANLFLVVVAVIAFAGSYFVLNQSMIAPDGEPTYRGDLTSEQRENLPDEIVESLPTRNGGGE